MHLEVVPQNVPRCIGVHPQDQVVLQRLQPHHAVEVAALEQTLEDQLLLGGQGIHAGEGAVELGLEEGVELLIVGFEVGEVVVQQVAVLEPVGLGQVLVHLERTHWSQA